MIRKTFVTGIAAMLALALANLSGVEAAPAMASQPMATSQSAGVLVGHVAWQGRQVGTPAYELPVKVTLERDGKTLDLPAIGTDDQGYFKLDLVGVDAATYKYVVRGLRFLSNSGQISLVSDPATIEVEMGVMRAGDCNSDNLVNVQDFSILKNSFGKAKGDEGYDVRADLTGDDKVTIQDFNLLRANFGLAGDE